MTTKEIYTLADEMTEQEVLNVVSGWENSKENKLVDLYKSLCDMGDSMQVACSTVIWEKINRPWMYDGSSNELERIAYES